MNWRIKGIVQKALSLLPGGSALNNRMQLRLGGLRDFEKVVDTKVQADWLVFADHLRKLRVPIEGKRLLEIGTGWYPTLPACFAIAGAASCLTFDVRRLLDWDLTRRMLLRLERHLPEMAARLDASESELRERWERLCAAAISRSSFASAASTIARRRTLRRRRCRRRASTSFSPTACSSTCPVR